MGSWTRHPLSNRQPQRIHTGLHGWFKAGLGLFNADGRLLPKACVDTGTTPSGCKVSANDTKIFCGSGSTIGSLEMCRSGAARGLCLAVKQNLQPLPGWTASTKLYAPLAAVWVMLLSCLPSNAGRDKKKVFHASSPGNPCAKSYRNSSNYSTPT